MASPEACPIKKASRFSPFIDLLSCKMSSDSMEDVFRQELFKRYEVCQKYLIPKTEYYRIIESLKSASTNNHTKIRSSYYLLSK